MGGRRGVKPAVRLFALLTAVVLGFGGISARLVQVQVVKASRFSKLGAEQRIKRVTLPAKRGTIFDRNGHVLAISVEARALYANPKFVSDPQATAEQISPILGIAPGILRDRLSNSKGFQYLARKVDLDAAERVLALGLPGIGAVEETKRIYPQGTLAGQLIGGVGTDNQGLAGVESGFEKFLGGIAGEEVVEQDPRGRPIPSGERTYRAPVRGKDLVLTIDRDVQFAAEEALARATARTGAKLGTAIVVDPATNEILAMANWPLLDPAGFSSAKPEARRNRAVQDAYEPGSVNKLVTAAAAIETGMVSPSDMLTIPNGLQIADKTFHDFKPHPTLRVTYAEALAQSSNIGTILVAQKLGKKRLHAMLERFGLGHKTGVEFPSESTGISLALKDWYKTSMGTIPIGQGIAVTPLQMVNVYSTIAHDGAWTQPRLIRKIDGDTLAPTNKARRVVSPFTATQLRAMLLNVVENGTGRNARIPGYLIGGKTGTARKPLIGARGYSKDVITTFIGVLPVSRPRFVVAVVLDDPGVHQSAVTAAPAFGEITKYLIGRFGLEPSFEPLVRKPLVAIPRAAAR
jgi:cell division protein FtsI (penicillin-binding protein 3)